MLYSDRDLAVIHDYLTCSIQTVQVETAKLQAGEASSINEVRKVLLTARTQVIAGLQIGGQFSRKQKRTR